MLASLVTSRFRADVTHAVASLIPGGAYASLLRGAGISVTELAIGPWPPNPWPVATLARLIRRTQPHIVQGWMYHGDLIATLGVMLSGRRRQTKLAWTLQCSPMDTRQYRRQLRMVVRVCAALSRRADVVISNSEAGLAGHVALGYRPRRACVIHPGIDTERFRPDRESARSVRQELGLPAEAPVVAHIARLDPMKDHACLFKAMERLAAVHFLAIGLGTETLPRHPTLHRLGERVDVERLLTACDASVSSSAFGEGFSNSVAESMAVGVPVAATDVGDTRTILGDTGHLVPPGSPQQLADAIRHLLGESPEARRARGARARTRVVTHFGRPRMVNEFTALYEELVGAPSRPSTRRA
jgi:glycosyltransferase involved in cell wall biosynthesis